MNTAEDLRQLAVARARAGALEEALALYDEARHLASDDELRELITINKADALIQLDRNGAEVQALPTILMRRRNPRNAFLAAYALLFKYRNSGEMKRAMFYGQIANEIAGEEKQPLWRMGTLNELGVVYEIDSQFEQAIQCFESAIAAMKELPNRAEHEHAYGTILENLGAAKLQIGQSADGVACILKAMGLLQSGAFIAEAHIDLCYGYLDLHQYAEARRHGEIGLEMAADERQTRNAHYLLGEACYMDGDNEAAEFHFTELCRLYPQFRNLKSLLFAIDLRSMLNLKS